MKKILVFFVLLGLTANLNGQERVSIVKPFKVANIGNFGTFRASFGLDFSTLLHFGLGFLSGLTSDIGFSRGLAIGIEYSDGFNTPYGFDLGDILAHETGYFAFNQLNLPTIWSNNRMTTHTNNLGKFLRYYRPKRKRNKPRFKTGKSNVDLLNTLAEVVLNGLQEIESKQGNSDKEIIALQTLMSANRLSNLSVLRAKLETDLKGLK